MAKKIKDKNLSDREKIELLTVELEKARNRYRQRELTEYGKQKQKEKTFHALKTIIYDLIELILTSINNDKLLDTVEIIKEKTTKIKL